MPIIAYMVNLTEKIEKYLIEKNKRYIEDLPNLEVGTVVIRVHGKNDWTYETYGDTKNVIIPLLKTDNQICCRCQYEHDSCLGRRHL